MKCDNKKCQNDFCDSPINHLKRIVGQLNKIIEYVENGEKCKDVAMLLKSTSTSFESAKQKILKNFILNEISKNEKITKKEKEKIEEIFNKFK